MMGLSLNQSDGSRVDACVIGLCLLCEVDMDLKS